MYRYSNYIARHLVHSMLLITFSLTSIVWLTQALRFIDFIVNQGVSIGIFLKLTALLVPSLLFMILPPAMLCAVLFVYNKLKLDSELVVMQAMGLSRWKLAMPALQVAMGVTLVTYFIALYLLPVSYRQFKDLQIFLRDNYASILLQEGVFSTPVDGLMVFIRERDNNNVLHGILVHDNRQPGSAITMMADQGKLVQTPQGPRFLLQGGNRQEMRDGKLSFLNFESYTLDISLYTESMKQRYIDPQEMFLPQLLTYDPTEKLPENRKRFAEGHQRLIWPAYSLCLTMVALALLLSGEFNRRGHGKRIALVVACGVVILFAAVGLRGGIAQDPRVAIIAYVNVCLPMVWAGMVLSGYTFARARMA